MATPLVFNLPLTSYSVGPNLLGPWNFPVNYTNAYVEVDRTQLNSLPPTTFMDVVWEISWLANRSDWTRSGSTTITGGTRIDEDATPPGPIMVDPLGINGIRQPTNPNRQVRVSLTVHGGPISFAAKVTLT